MSEEGAEPAPAGPAAAAPSPQPLNILDAVCVLYFATSGQLSLLVDILTAANYRILLPTEVLKEVRDKASRNGWNISALDYRLRGGSGARIVEIPEISAAQVEAATLLTIEDAFSLAMKHDVLDTLNARKAYDKLRPHGNSLPSWEAELKPRLKRERTARNRAESEAKALHEGDEKQP